MTQPEANCVFPDTVDFRIEGEGKGSVDFDANLIVEGIETAISCEDVGGDTLLCSISNAGLNGQQIQAVEIILSKTGGPKLVLAEFLGRPACSENNRDIPNEAGITGTCDGAKIEFDAENGDEFDIITPFLEQFLFCNPITDMPTGSPTQSPTFSIDEINEENNSAAIFGGVGGIAVLVLICAFFVARKKQKERMKTSTILDPSSLDQNVTLQPKVSGYKAERRDFAESMGRFDTMDMTRISGLSMLTTNTSISSRSNISQQDTDSYYKVRSVISTRNKQYDDLSRRVAQQIERLTLNTMELKHTDNYINERVLNNVIPFVKALITPAKTFDSKLDKFNVATSPRVSLKFYISRLIMGLNGWYYDDEKSFEVGIRCLFIALIYLDNLPSTVKGFRVTNLNIYKLLATFMLVAAKFTEDEVITNSYWADVCGYSVDVVNDLEALLCFNFGFDFNVHPEDLSKLFALFQADEGIV